MKPDRRPQEEMKGCCESGGGDKRPHESRKAIGVKRSHGIGGRGGKSEREKQHEQTSLENIHA